MWSSAWHRGRRADTSCCFPRPGPNNRRARYWCAPRSICGHVSGTGRRDSVGTAPAAACAWPDRRCRQTAPYRNPAAALSLQGYFLRGTSELLQWVRDCISARELAAAQPFWRLARYSRGTAYAPIPLVTAAPFPIPPLHEQVAEVTARVRSRSHATRADYLRRMHLAQTAGVARGRLGCTNLAHGFAAAGGDKDALRRLAWPNIAIVSAYHDLLSAHQPFERFPALIKMAAREAGAVAQFAGGVPAMCDGITQGFPGMELSLFSRDVIAMSTAIALTHDLFDAALCLGVCDKIVPGLVIGALAFGHLPVIFVPAGPMSSGISNAEKARTRALYAEGKATREELLESESKSYHGPGTCTFYGTANSNQMMMEMMGLHLPGSAFVSPNTPLRDALVAAAPRRAVEIGAHGNAYAPMAAVVSEKSLVNALAGLLATGGSTNHTLHLIAMARAAGIELAWEDFDAVSGAVPLIARVYPSGSRDVNEFHAAGGMAYVIRQR